jgi:hypothetical protein
MIKIEIEEKEYSLIFRILCLALNCVMMEEDEKEELTEVMCRLEFQKNDSLNLNLGENKNESTDTNGKGN